MKQLLLLLCIVMLGMVACNNNTEALKEEIRDREKTIEELRSDIESLSNYIPKFPEDWVGEYEGELEIFIKNQPEPIQKIPAEFTIKGDSIPNQWTWKSVYNDDQRGVTEKNYTLKKDPDTAPHEFIFDENNGIAFPQYYLGDVFHSHYSLYNQMFTVTYKKLSADVILFELVVIPMEVIDSVTIDDFVVNSHSLSQIQRAYFRKK